MRAFVLLGPGRGAVQDVAPPSAAPGEVIVDVERVGVCGTDAEFFSGAMPYLHDGNARYPIRIGHEWTGTVTSLGDGVDEAWLGRRVTGDTMLGCGVCVRCRAGRHHVCANRTEIGIRGGRDGALAEQLAVPAVALHALPDEVDATCGALVEPGANALRAVRAAGAGRVLVVGPGTIGLLCGLFARAAGAEVGMLGPDEQSLAFAASLGLARGDPDGRWDAVVDATGDPSVPARAVRLVEPGGRVVYIGLAETPSLVDTRDLVLADVTAVGILSASPALADTVAGYAAGAVDPSRLVAAVVGLGGVADVLAGRRPPGAGPGPKIHVDPRLP